jgi:hypothetical protein
LDDPICCVKGPNTTISVTSMALVSTAGPLAKLGLLIGAMFGRSISWI